VLGPSGVNLQAQIRAEQPVIELVGGHAHGLAFREIRSRSKRCLP
jgi:hypothetical protein